MKDLVEYIIKNVLGSEKFEVNEKSNDSELTYTVKVPSLDMGLLIGKGGKTIKAIRKILKVRATLENVKVNLDLEDKS